MNNDDELAPMVDGLSGALCVFILLTTVFMISATDIIVSDRKGVQFTFNNSSLFLDERRVEFQGGIRIPLQDIYKIRQDLKQMNSPVIFIHIPENVKNKEQKMVYNLAQMKAKLNLNIPIKYRYSKKSKCKETTSCIYWAEEN